jgi:hypothetical protein
MSRENVEVLRTAYDLDAALEESGSATRPAPGCVTRISSLRQKGARWV